jgi:two-component system nitrate/nitrite response regulator NarL
MKSDSDKKLTKREQHVLQLLAEGMNRDKIAKELYISPETVKMHVKNLYKKLEAKNKIDALTKMNML